MAKNYNSTLINSGTILNTVNSVHFPNSICYLHIYKVIGKIVLVGDAMAWLLLFFCSSLKGFKENVENVLSFYTLKNKVWTKVWPCDQVKQLTTQPQVKEAIALPSRVSFITFLNYIIILKTTRIVHWETFFTIFFYQKNIKLSCQYNSMTRCRSAKQIICMWYNPLILKT